MKYIKYFEARNFHEEVETDKEDIIKILTQYVKDYSDYLTTKLYELMWSVSAEASDREDEFGMDGECVRMIVNDVFNQRDCETLLNIYYDMNGILNGGGPEVIQDLNDIFADYNFNKEVKISRSSDRGDERYVIDINSKDIILKIDFIEIINRVKQLTGIEDVSYDGTKDHITLEFYRKAVKSDDNEGWVGELS